MNRRDFLKLTGGSIAAGVVGVTLTSEAKEKPIPTIKEQTNAHENTYGYARLIREYDIYSDEIMNRLDVIDDKGIMYQISFQDGVLEAAKKQLKKDVPIFKPMPYIDGMYKCEFIKV